MKDRKYVAWLYEQLPMLVSDGVLTPDIAQRLHQHYGAVDAQGRRRWAMTLFSILGALFIGGGIILLLAHNWDNLSRPVRAALALAPLVLSQILAGWVLQKQPDSAPWREGVGTFLTLSIGLSIALISQTYHTGGELSDFLLTWGLLGLPVAYLLQATLPALLYVIDITVWTGNVTRQGWTALWYWPLLLAVLPHLWLLARRNRYQPQVLWLCWLLALSLPLASGLAMHHVLESFGMWVLWYSTVAGVLYLAGALVWNEATSFWQRPWQILGALGVVGFALAFSFADIWYEVLRVSPWRDLAGRPWQAQVAWYLALLWPIAAVLLWVDSLRQRHLTHIFLGAMPVLTMIGYTLGQGTPWPWLGILLFNGYLLALGVSMLVVGLRERRLGVINGGMAILAALIVCRFFDADLSFIWRGIVFILLGIGFLGTNLMFLRHKGV